MKNSWFTWPVWLVTPDLCIGCCIPVEEGRRLCVRCINTIRPVVSERIPLTHNVTMVVHAVGAYEGVLALLVKAKHSRSLAAASVLADLIATQMVDLDISFDVVTTIPMHWRRYAARGFNHAEEIAVTVAQSWSIPYAETLYKNRYTTTQASCSDAEARRLNQEKSYECLDKAPCIRGKHVVLIDDVMTTGATLRSAARELLYKGPATITAIVGARTC